MSSPPAKNRITHACARTSGLAGLLLVICMSFALANEAAAQSTCGLTTRDTFAGHSLPLDGELVRPNIGFRAAFPPRTTFAITQPIFVTAPADGTDRVFLLTREGQIYALPNRRDTGVNDLSLVLDLRRDVDSNGGEDGLFALAFHPNFRSNGYFYVHYTSVSSGCSESTRCAKIARYQIPSATPNRADARSAFAVLEINRPGRAETHNGGMIAFGGDGYLYIGVGDQENSRLAKDLTSLRGKILRIDVNSGVERSPGIPPGNPFGDEIWLYGLRNPFRFSFDRQNPNDLWVSDVGSTEQEEVTWLPANTGGGLDLGWPDCEGVTPLTRTGCTSRMRAPDLVYDRVGARRAITGGYVYRGAISTLSGHYVFGDLSGEVFSWDRSSRNGRTGMGEFTPLPNVAINRLVSFGEDESGELFALSINSSTPLRIAPDGGAPNAEFPELLSDTGFFSDVANLTPSRGMLEYDVASALYSDDALKRRWLALPGNEKIRFRNKEPWEFPVGTALIKHFELERRGRSPRRVETRILLHQNTGWLGLTYKWNAAGTDARLLRDSDRETIALGGGEEQQWLYPSPADCLFCHTQAAGRVLGIETRQINRDFDYGGITDNQLHAWNCIDLFDTDIGRPSWFGKLAALDDTTASLGRRVRDHLQSNCSHCHRPGTGITDMDLRRSTLLTEANMIGRPPIRGNLGRPGARLVTPGSSRNSIVPLRMTANDEGSRMAWGTLRTHVAAARMVNAWIDQTLFDSTNQTARIDSDEDGINDANDTCPSIPDPSQADADRDGVGDLCDPDLLPDLEPGPVTPQRAQPGVRLNLRLRAFNRGATRSPVTQNRVYLSEDTELDDADLAIGDCFLPPLAPGAFSQCFDVAARLPDASVVPDGPYYWIACADSLDQSNESDETDNCTASRVNVPEPGFAGALLLSAIALLAGRARRDRIDLR